MGSKTVLKIEEFWVDEYHRQQPVAEFYVNIPQLTGAQNIQIPMVHTDAYPPLRTIRHGLNGDDFIRDTLLHPLSNTRIRMTVYSLAVGDLYLLTEIDPNVVKVIRSERRVPREVDSHLFRDSGQMSPENEGKGPAMGARGGRRRRRKSRKWLSRYKRQSRKVRGI